MGSTDYPAPREAPPSQSSHRLLVVPPSGSVRWAGSVPKLSGMGGTPQAPGGGRLNMHKAKGEASPLPKEQVGSREGAGRSTEGDRRVWLGCDSVWGGDTHTCSAPPSNLALPRGANRPKLPRSPGSSSLRWCLLPGPAHPTPSYPPAREGLGATSLKTPCPCAGSWDVLHPDGFSGWPFTDLCLNTGDREVASHPRLG